MSGKFANSEAVRLRFQGFAGDCVLALEANLSEVVLHTIEQALLPAPTEAQKAQAYAEAQTLLATRGLRAGDPVLDAATQEATRLSTGAVPPGVR